MITKQENAAIVTRIVNERGGIAALINKLPLVERRLLAVAIAREKGKTRSVDALTELAMRHYRKYLDRGGYNKNDLPHALSYYLKAAKLAAELGRKEEAKAAALTAYGVARECSLLKDFEKENGISLLSEIKFTMNYSAKADFIAKEYKLEKRECAAADESAKIMADSEIDKHYDSCYSIRNGGGRSCGDC